MRTRIISGAIIAAIVIAIIFLPPMALYIFCMAASVVGLYELYKAYGMEKTLLAYAGIAATVVYYLLLKTDFSFNQMAGIIIGFIGIMAAYVVSFPKYRSDRAGFAIFGFIYVGVMMSMMFYVRNLYEGKWLLPLVFISAWINDTCAYFVGMKFGKRRLAPVLSPKKSIEGFAGGIAGAFVFGLIYGIIFSRFSEMWTNTGIKFGLICAVAAAISVLGDLTASAIKRDKGIKDYGNIIPGHGGIMDRFDSILFTAPVVFLLLMIAF